MNKSENIDSSDVVSSSD